VKPLKTYQKQRLLKRFKAPLVVLCALALSSCGHIPERPKGEICGVVDSNPPACACVDSETGNATRVITITECAGYIAISPNYYNELETWIQALIQKIRGFPIFTDMASAEVEKIRVSVDAARKATIEKSR